MMRRTIRLWSLVAVVLATALTAAPRAQSISNVKPLIITSGTLNATNANCVAAACVQFELGGYKTVMVAIAGSGCVCTVSFEAAGDTANTWVLVNMLPISGTQTAVTSAANPAGVWNGQVPMARFRARISAYTSGSVVITLRGTL